MFSRSSAIGLATFSLATAASALPNGIANSSCSGCHSADVDYDGTLALVANGELAPGLATSFTLRIEESHMRSAGFFVYSAGVGTFTAGSGSRVMSDGIVHSRPASADDGVVEFEFSWTPPEQANGLDMWVYVVAADDSSSQTGDIAVSATFPFVWGCDGLTLYEDIDGDGYGSADGARSLGCAAREGWSTTGTDCNDLWVSIHPGATETANRKDDDCNGEVDDGIVINTWYADRDGDGFGDVGTVVEAQDAPEGYVANGEDCSDLEPTVSPLGIETCDGVDNDCNHVIDDGEGVYVTCGVGICSRRLETCDTECVPGTPLVEICDGLDDDCDGEVDEDVTCPDGSPCESGRCPVVDADAATSGLAASADAAAEDAATTWADLGTSIERAHVEDAGAITTAPSRDASAAANHSTRDASTQTAKPRAINMDGEGGGCTVRRAADTSWTWLAFVCVALALRRHTASAGHRADGLSRRAYTRTLR